MELKYHKKIYTKKGLKSAIEAFSALAEWSLDSDDEYYIVSCNNIDESLRDSVADEFGNFALHGSIRG